MAYVVLRPNGRWEIRESAWTAHGPRATTLASFTRLTAETLDRAAARAGPGFDRAQVVESALRRGAPVETSPADEAAAALLRSLGRGERVRPGLRRLIADLLADPRSVDDELARWVRAAMDERGRALRDLLDLTDRLPKRAAGPLRFPVLQRSGT